MICHGMILIRLLPGEHTLQVFPDLSVEHAVEQEDREALQRRGQVSAGLGPRREARALPLPHRPPACPEDARSIAQPRGADGAQGRCGRRRPPWPTPGLPAPGASNFSRSGAWSGQPARPVPGGPPPRPQPPGHLGPQCCIIIIRVHGVDSKWPASSWGHSGIYAGRGGGEQRTAS